MTDPSEPPLNVNSAPGNPAPARRKRRVFFRRMTLGSPLTWRILAVNVLAPVILVAGLFYLDRYKNELIAAELASLRVRGEMLAAAVAEGAVIDSTFAFPELSQRLARQMVRHLSQPAHVRARLFDPDGILMADSRLLLSSSAIVQVEDLEPPERNFAARLFRRVYDFVTMSNLVNAGLPVYHDHPRTRAEDFPEVMEALIGEPGEAVRRTTDNRLILTTAVPVQRYKEVLAVVLLSAPGDDIAQSLFKVRLTIFQAFAFALVITITLSLYLAGTIARPIRRLAAAADRVRRGHGRRHSIPDLTKRGDEIGDLSGALRDMTETLWRRMDAVEAFAADVAHEIKNPLTSLRSAVETVAQVSNPDHQRKLMAIIQDDVSRLDRLISDISDASRIDAELSRAETEPVKMRQMVQTLVEVYQDTGIAGGVRFAIDCPNDDDLEVHGIESRLVQVLRNLITNALSFSPPDGHITLRAFRQNKTVVVEVADDGPGIPQNKLEAIFERFYSERPVEEKFGTHSGLGLSISKQIAESHGGTLKAANRLAPDNATIIGALFTLTLPASPQMLMTAGNRPH